MPVPIRIIKIDPERRLIVQMPMVPSIRGVRQLINATATNIGWRKLVEDVHGEHLLCASRTNVDEEKPLKEWRLRGGENTAGMGILFGTLNKKMDGMWHCPVTKSWVERNIIWAEPGDDAKAEEVNTAVLEPDPEGEDQAARDAAFLRANQGGNEDGSGQDQ